MDGSFPTEVVPQFLFLGSYENASNLKQLQALGITHILNMADELENKYPGTFTYKQCGVNDTKADNISKFFEDALQYIGTFCLEDQPILY